MVMVDHTLVCRAVLLLEERNLVADSEFYEFSDDDKLRLKQDWLIVRDFLIVIHREYNTQEEREAQYPRLSSELRSQLMLIDTAPKFPNSPRFRLKRSFATIIADQYFSNHLLEKLNSPITKYSDIDEKCNLIVKYENEEIINGYTTNNYSITM